MSDPHAPIDPFAAGGEPEQPSASGQPTPPPGETPPPYGAQPPAYGAQPPAYGAQPPAYGAQPPAYGAQPPVYGAQPPDYGAQPPAYGAQPPAYGAQPPAPYGGYAGQPAYGYPKNSLGVWSLVLGIASFVLGFGLLTGIPAIIVGNMGKRAATEGLANNLGLSKAGVILGWIATVLSVLAIIGGIIFFAVLISNGDFQNAVNDSNLNNM
ncbi:MAG: DUF4190 domain-containing protein [Cellulomonas sp.]